MARRRERRGLPAPGIRYDHGHILHQFELQLVMTPKAADAGEPRTPPHLIDRAREDVCTPRTRAQPPSTMISLRQSACRIETWPPKANHRVPPPPPRTPLQARAAMRPQLSQVCRRAVVPERSRALKHPRVVIKDLDGLDPVRIQVRREGGWRGRLGAIITASTVAAMPQVHAWLGARGGHWGGEGHSCGGRWEPACVPSARHERIRRAGRREERARASWASRTLSRDEAAGVSGPPLMEGVLTSAAPCPRDTSATIDLIEL